MVNCLTCIAQFVHVSCPSVFSWTHKSSTPRPSKKEGTFDQPQEAVRWLKLLKALNSTHLSEVMQCMSCIVGSGCRNDVLVCV